MSTTAPETFPPRPTAGELGVVSDRPASADSFTPLELANVLLRRWRKVAAAPLLLVALTAGVVFVIPPGYTATTTFVPEVRSPTNLPAGLTSLTGQLGIPLGGQPSQSPQFYASVVTSRELLERVLLSRYPDPRSPSVASDSTTLLRILGVKGRTSADSLQRGVKKLLRLISVDADNQTNIVRLSVSGRYPVLAATVANRLVKYLNEFNAQTRQSQARERRKFTEQRVADAGAALREAEEAVRTFYERNRGWQQAPELVFQDARLRRQVEVSQEVYLTMRRQYETARIDEVNDTPVLTVIDPATPPEERSRPNRILWILTALAFGGIAGVFVAFAADYGERARHEEPRRYREFRGLVERMRGEISGGLRMLVRPRSVHRAGSNRDDAA